MMSEAQIYRNTKYATIGGLILFLGSPVLIGLDPDSVDLKRDPGAVISVEVSGSPRGCGGMIIIIGNGRK